MMWSSCLSAQRCDLARVPHPSCCGHCAFILAPSITGLWRFMFVLVWRIQAVGTMFKLPCKLEVTWIDAASRHFCAIRQKMKLAAGN